MMKNIEFDNVIMKFELPLSSDQSYIDKVHVFVYDTLINQMDYIIPKSIMYLSLVKVFQYVRVVQVQ